MSFPLALGSAQLCSLDAWRHESSGAIVEASGRSVWLTRYLHEYEPNCLGVSLHGVVISMHMHLGAERCAKRAIRANAFT